MAIDNFNQDISDEYVEHFFNVMVDKEISSDVLCSEKIKHNKSNLFSDLNIVCPERKKITRGQNELGENPVVSKGCK